MKIALLGEFSGLHNNLKYGLNSLGHDVTIIGTCDGFKKIDVDIEINSGTSIKDKLIRIYQYYNYVYNLKEYDIVQIINSSFLVKKNEFITKKIIDKLVKNNEKVFLAGCGGDIYVYEFYKTKKYSPYKDISNIKNKLEINKLGTKYVIESVRKVIPNLYEYSKPYEKFGNINKTIPMPINLEKNKFIKNTINNKIVIFHGLNREEAKGSKYIISALKRIKDKYNESVEIIIDGKLPLDKYIELLKKTNIVIDQCLTYGYGMNALYNLAMGKVVFSGSEKETLDDLGIDECPIINIIPDQDYIFNEIEKFILNPKLIKEYSIKGREYVEKYHDSKVIAEKYLEVWENS